MVKAVSVLAEFLDSDVDYLRRLAASYLIEKYFKSAELIDLAERVAILEAKVK